MANAPQKHGYRRIVADIAFVALAFGIVVSLSAGCGPDEQCSGATCLRGSGLFDQMNQDGGDGTNAPAAPACTVGGNPHIGLGGVDVAATFDAPAYVDRARVKPYSALVTEYTRVLGAKNTSPLLGATDVDKTFGAPPDRWYIEPLASSVLINTAYNVAFEGCLRLTGDVSGGAPDARFAAAPTADSAKAVCSEWIRKFWSRAAAPDQVDACVAVALESTTETYGGGSVAEQSRPVTPKRQWAYACASVLSATGFLMY